MRILREPLLHFLVLGSLVYGASVLLGDDGPRYRIDAGPQRRARLRAAYEQQYGVTPTALQLRDLVDQYVRDEILYREGLALGLQQDDEIVRRRVVQKLEFVNEDLEPQAQPDESTLASYFENHRDRYNTVPTVSFVHVFISTDSVGEAGALARAHRLLQELRKSEATVDRRRTANGTAGDSDVALGDPFAEGQQFSTLSRAAANTLFGDSQLSEALFTQPVGGWGGPYRSAYGWHLVRVGQRQASQPASLSDVRKRVLADYVADLRAQRNLLAFRRIASKYRVITEEPRI